MNSVHDPYTVYLSPREIQGLNESLSGGNFGGIGVYIYQLKDGRIVVQPIEDMPAARAGMKPGEVVDTVDGKPVRGVSIDRVEELIRGEAGTTVRLRAHPYNGPAVERTYAIVREIIHVPTVRAKMEDGIDYIRLSDFGTTSGGRSAQSAARRASARARAAISSICATTAAACSTPRSQISSLFVPQGTIVSTIRRDGERTTEEALGDAIGGLHPLVILVNKYTASASEITVGRAAGLPPGDAHRHAHVRQGRRAEHLPNARPGRAENHDRTLSHAAGRDIQHHGIEPDVVVNQDPNPSLIDTPADKQLAAAKARLRGLITLIWRS